MKRRHVLAKVIAIPQKNTAVRYKKLGTKRKVKILKQFTARNYTSVYSFLRKSNKILERCFNSAE